MFNRESQSQAVGVYGCLEVTQMAIEAVGELDRKKIRDEMAKGPFKTVWGDLQFKDQRNTNPWAMGQWQNGEVVGLYPVEQGRREAAAVPEARMVVTTTTGSGPGRRVALPGLPYRGRG